MVSKEKIEEITKKADILTVISKYLPVQKSGRNYLSICPFHDDKNPSMTISIDKQIYKCFSCGESGGVINFVQKYTNTDFLNALKQVAEIANVNLEIQTFDIKSKYSFEEEKLFQINETAANFYQVLLASKQGEMAQNYLNQRHFHKEEILEWNVGYSNSKFSLTETLLQQNIALDDIQKAGLVTIKNGNFTDYFQDRIIFLIKNEDGKIIGFSGRAISQETVPKYLNTRETSIFKKSHLIYNLDQAVKEIYSSKNLIVLEGFIDVISLKRIGIKNCVALMGTNLSNEQIEKFKKLKVEIKLFLDGDLAGIKATIKMIQKLLKEKISVKIIDNQTDYDPDELIRLGRDEQVHKMLNHPIEPLQYIQDKLLLIYDLKKDEDLKKYLSEIFNLMRLSQDAIIQEHTLNSLTSKIKFEKTFIEKMWQEYNHSFDVQPTSFHLQNKTSYKNKKLRILKGYEFSQRDILHSLIVSQMNLQLIEENIHLIPDPNLSVILREMITRYRLGTYHENNWDELMDIFKNSNFDYQDPNWKINLKDLEFFKLTSQRLNQSFYTLEEYQLQKKAESLSEQIKKAENLEQKKYFLKMKEKIQLSIYQVEKKRKNNNDQKN